MDRSKGIGGLIELPNQDSIYLHVCLSACYGCIVGYMLLYPYPTYDIPSEMKTTPTRAARFIFSFSIFDHAYRRDIHTIYAY